MNDSKLLYSTTTGQGDTIVMLHGYLASGQYFKHIRKRLEPNYRIVTLDLLGFGKSPKPKVRYTYDDHVRAIDRTLKHLRITTQPFILLGHSMGALIALRYATIYPDSIAKLILFNPPLFTDRAQLIDTHKSSAKHYRTLLYSRARHIYWPALRLLPRTHSPWRSAINITDMLSMSPAAREGSYRHVIGNAKVFTDLRKVISPTLVVNGGNDRDIYRQNLRSRVLAPSVVVQTVDSDHHTLVRNVDIAEKIIRSYLIQ